MDRRSFLKAAGSSALSAALLGACEDDVTPRPVVTRPAERVTEHFTRDGPGWGERWLNVRYEGPWSVRSGQGIVEVEPAVEKALQEGKEVAEYMAR
ncbi:MAG: twin-arginine translocation signal domain-containing protein, partial [Actinomycetota bacterium]|nr:twin-arginine translocation signal domain-containing protein [Actinomycetota bacterium]